MKYSAHLGCAFVITSFVWQTICICRGPYMNVCSYNGDEYNSTKVESNFSSFCDCEEVTHCYIIKVSQDCKTPLIRWDTNNSLLNQSHCEMASLDSQESPSAYEILNRTEDEFVLRVLTEVGRFIFTCHEVGEVFNTSYSSQWEIVSINPSEVLVDSEVKLQLTVVKQATINGTWCFVNTPDGSIEILMASWVSDTQLDCIGFNPRTSNFFKVSLGTTITPNIFDNGITMKVTSKRPVAQKAEYSYDFETILIHFDTNIELHSTCVKVFSKDTQENFGEDFECFVNGNILVVKMGVQFQHIDNVAIDQDNKICQAGSQDDEFCLSASPASLNVIKQKLPGPKLSLCLKSACSGNEAQKYVVKVTPYKGSTSYVVQNQSLHMKTSGKTQRKNLMVWRRMREFQSKFPRQAALEMNMTDVLPILENSQSVDSVLNGEDDISGSSAKVSLLVKSSPESPIVVAEADVKFCEDAIKSFRYKWLVDGMEVFEEGKLLILKNLTPGVHMIKCLVVADNSTEILGQGWSTVEVFEREEEVFIIPLEITTGTADDIPLRAVSSYNISVSWNCRTLLGEPCLTTKMELINGFVDLNSPNITIPAGILPVGGYIWTVENAGGSNTAKVFVKPGNVPLIQLEISSVFVKPEEFVLAGSVRTARGDCSAWWSSVRELGFSYFHHDRSAGFSMVKKFPAKISLTIPSESSENQQGSYDYIKIPVVVSNAPRVSPLTVEPTAGKAMITNFVVSGGGADASSDDCPLTFEWSYIDSCGAEVTIGRGAFGRNFKTFLPPGDLRLIVRVCDGENICSTVSSSMISVVQASEFPAENFRNVRNQIERLMASGETLEAFGLAVTVFKSLGLVAESEIREEMYSAVEQGIKRKVEDLTKRLGSDPRAGKLSLEFFERAVQVAKYFRKGSGIMLILSEFKNNVNSMKH